MGVRCAAKAAQRHGVVTRAELLALGVTSGTIGRWVHGGRLHPVFRGVYALGHPHLDVVGRAHAALLAIGGDACLSHRSAAWLFALLPEPAVHHVTTSNRSGKYPEGIVVHRVRSAPPLTTRHGLRTTTLERALLDLAHTEDLPTLQRVLNEADYRRLLDVPALETLTASSHPGAANLRRALEQRAPARSHLEDRFYALLKQARLPLPLVNQRIAGYEVDFVWREQRLVVETDGRAAHGTAGQRARDARKDRALLAAGYEVTRMTWAEVEREPYAVVARISAFLTRPARP